ncbi:MAG: hypothetical protein ACXVI9_13865 [Mucilaginibacter sp.]
MRIKSYRLFILGFVAASFILLTGFEQSDVNKVLPSSAEKQVVSEVKKDQSSFVKPKEKKTKHRQKAVPNAKNLAAEEAELQKPLDLSMPFKDSESAGLTIEQNRAVQEESLNIFSSGKNKMPRPLYLDGQMLMSQEPEGDKRKSFDGAGIVINLKR